MLKLHNLYSHNKIDVYFKQTNDTFIVAEEPLYEFSGDGEHLVLYIRKKDLTTNNMVQILAKYLNTKAIEFGYAGLKDKNGLTYQYISINKKYEKKLDNFLHPNIKIINKTYHKNKIKIGHLKGNSFKIKLKKVMPIHFEIIKNVVNNIEKFGIVNYFGTQRFGNDGNNYQLGLDILKNNYKIKNKKIKKFLINSYQSYLFNIWLSKRVEFSKIIDSFKSNELKNILNLDINSIKELKLQPHIFKILKGDLMHHYPYGRLFEIDDIKSEAEKFYQKDRVPTGILVGNRIKVSKDFAYTYEKDIFEENIKYFENFKINGDRRFAIVFPKDFVLEYDKNNKHLDISFYLPKGSYATEVIRQILNEEFGNA